jgi:hypothetical protein
VAWRDVAWRGVAWRGVAWGFKRQHIPCTHQAAIYPNPPSI